MMQNGGGLSTRGVRRPRGTATAQEVRGSVQASTTSSTRFCTSKRARVCVWRLERAPKADPGTEFAGDIFWQVEKGWALPGPSKGARWMAMPPAVVMGALRGWRVERKRHP